MSTTTPIDSAGSGLVHRPTRPPRLHGSGTHNNARAPVTPNGGGNPRAINENAIATTTRTDDGQMLMNFCIVPTQHSLDDEVTIRGILERLDIEYSDANRVRFNAAIKAGKLEKLDRPGKTSVVLWRDVLAYLKTGTHHQRRRNAGVPAGSNPAPAGPVVDPTSGAPTEDAPPPFPVDVEVMADHAGGGTTSPGAPGPSGIDADAADFERLDQVVRKGIRVFIDVGLALKEIRTRELWRSSGFRSWAAYFKNFDGMSKRHADRLITSAEIAEHISKLGPAGPIVPYAESQVRPLSGLPCPDQWVDAWRMSVERKGGGHPTRKLVAQVVAEMKGSTEAIPPPEPEPEPQPEPEPDFAGRFDIILEAVRAERPYKEIEVLLTEFGNFIGLFKRSSSNINFNIL